MFVSNISDTTTPSLPPQPPKANTEIATQDNTMWHYFARFRLRTCYCSWPPNNPRVNSTILLSWDFGQPVDPVVGDPVRQDNDKIWVLGSFAPSLCVVDKQFPYIFVYSLPVPKTSAFELLCVCYPLWPHIAQYYDNIAAIPPIACYFPGRNYMLPPPISARRPFSERGGGCIFWSPPRQNFIRAPSVYTPHP